ncbi:MAG: NAD kinase [Lactobacillales bacterium]|jgi:NAD+ kinase|nr:NAD kinase [Lactobacillales bacterium]
MRVAIFNNQEFSTLEVVKKLRQLLEIPFFALDDECPEIVLTVGGDGTLISAVHRYENQLDTVQFVGIHTGHLGFYTDWREFELKELVESLKLEERCYVSYPLLEVEVEHNEGKECFLALNESTIRSLNRTLVGRIYIKEEFFENFRGDGLSISTPTGSTAYSKALGGAVIHPSINAIQLAEIASLNNRVFRTLGSPMVIGAHEWIRIALESSMNYVITFDSEVIQLEDVRAITYRIAKKRIRFVSYRHLDFWDRVKKSFIVD